MKIARSKSFTLDWARSAAHNSSQDFYVSFDAYYFLTKTFFLSNLLKLVSSNINSINFREFYLVNNITRSGLKCTNCLESLPKYTFFIRTNKF